MGIVVSRGYLLDTNHLGHAVSIGSLVRDRITRLSESGLRVGTCIPVLCEIEAGIQQVRRPEEYRANLRKLMKHVRIWPVDLETAKHYGIIHSDLKRRGRVLSQVDIMLAALARQSNLKLVTTDSDFKALPDISCENWIA